MNTTRDEGWKEKKTVNKLEILEKRHKVKEYLWSSCNINFSLLMSDMVLMKNWTRASTVEGCGAVWGLLHAR